MYHVLVRSALSTSATVRPVRLARLQVRAFAASQAADVEQSSPSDPLNHSIPTSVPVSDTSSLPEPTPTGTSSPHSPSSSSSSDCSSSPVEPSGCLDADPGSSRPNPPRQSSKRNSAAKQPPSIKRTKGKSSSGAEGARPRQDTLEQIKGRTSETTTVPAPPGSGLVFPAIKGTYQYSPTSSSSSSTTPPPMAAPSISTPLSGIPPPMISFGRKPPPLLSPAPSKASKLESTTVPSSLQPPTLRKKSKKSAGRSATIPPLPQLPKSTKKPTSKATTTPPPPQLRAQPKKSVPESILAETMDLILQPEHDVSSQTTLTASYKPNSPPPPQTKTTSRTIHNETQPRSPPPPPPSAKRSDLVLQPLEPPSTVPPSSIPEDIGLAPPAVTATPTLTAAPIPTPRTTASKADAATPQHKTSLQQFNRMSARLCLMVVNLRRESIDPDCPPITNRQDLIRLAFEDPLIFTKTEAWLSESFGSRESREGELKNPSTSLAFDSISTDPDSPTLPASLSISGSTLASTSNTRPPSEEVSSSPSQALPPVSLASSSTLNNPPVAHSTSDVISALNDFLLPPSNIDKVDNSPSPLTSLHDGRPLPIPAKSEPAPIRPARTGRKPIKWDPLADLVIIKEPLGRRPSLASPRPFEPSGQDSRSPPPPSPSSSSSSPSPSASSASSASSTSAFTASTFATSLPPPPPMLNPGMELSPSLVVASPYDALSTLGPRPSLALPRLPVQPTSNRPTLNLPVFNRPTPNRPTPKRSPPSLASNIPPPSASRMGGFSSFGGPTRAQGGGRLSFLDPLSSRAGTRGRGKE